jgi:hypothetical protein
MLGLFISSGGLSICDADFEHVPELARPEGAQARYELTATCAISLDDEAELCGVYEEIIPTRFELGIRKLAGEDSALETSQDKKEQQ